MERIASVHAANCGVKARMAFTELECSVVPCQVRIDELKGLPTHVHLHRMLTGTTMTQVTKRNYTTGV